jgi:murein DD-endopeptidase MepM/ murein hydrolase activator NlpD
VRTTQHKGRYAHKALDIINSPKSVVWSTQDGKVVLKDRFAFSGNTVVIDHGMGVLSLFFHLDNFADIKEGDKIAKGEPIGTIGKTGYADGYHLHWEMRVDNIPVDPMQWTNIVL